MKKILVTITAIILTVAAYAQSDRKVRANSDTGSYQTSTKKYPDGFIMKNGRVMRVKDNRMTTLKNDTTLSNGTMVMSNGQYMKKGEAKMMLKEGQHIDMSGNVVSMPHSNDQGSRKDGNKKMYLVDDTIRNKKGQQ
jgi:hypothetical protein